MSSSKVFIPSLPQASWNFTESLGQAFGGGQKQIRAISPRFGARAGDGNGDGGIDAVDRNMIWRPANGSPGYKNGDFYLDGGVDAVDRNRSWRPNNGSGTAVP